MIIQPGSEEDVPGQVTINSRGAEARERAKWEQFDTEYTRRVGITGHFKPGNPPESRDNLEYPKMLYIALPSPFHNGQRKCMIPMPVSWEYPSEDAYQRARDHAEHFNTACQRIVGNRAEEDAQRAQGYRETVAAALELYTEQRMEKFIQTGHREWDDRNLSEKAKAEKEAFEAAHPGHQPEIPRQPVVKPLAEGKKADYAARAEKRKATLAAKKAAESGSAA